MRCNPWTGRQYERNCVEESLELATHIVAKDIRIQLKRKGESLSWMSFNSFSTRKKAITREKRVPPM
jgi:hypothetical protein